MQLTPGSVIFLGFILLDALVSSTNALKCYDCEYEGNGFDKACDKSKLIQCPDPQHVCISSFGVLDGKSATKKMCMTDPLMRKKDLCFKGSHPGKDTIETTCFCTTDGCNSQSKDRNLCKICDDPKKVQPMEKVWGP